MAKSHPDQGVATVDLSAYGIDSLVECPVCGRTDFQSVTGTSLHVSKSHENAVLLPKEFVKDLYEERDFSLRQIASVIGAGRGVVETALDHYGVELKTATANKPPTHRFTKRSEKVGHEYEMVQTLVGESSKHVYIHRLIAVAKGDLDGSDFCNRNLHVHHKSEHGLDNRHKNLEVKTVSDHMRDHKKK